MQKTLEILDREIPANWIELAREWHDGQNSMLYAIASTGGLTRGSIKPSHCETNAEWQMELVSHLWCDLKKCYDDAEWHGMDDADELHKFLEFTEQWQDDILTLID